MFATTYMAFQELNHLEKIQQKVVVAGNHPVVIADVELDVLPAMV